MGVTIRDAGERDAEAIARLLSRLGYPTTAAQARRQRCSVAEVTTSDSRADAHAFFEQLGFARTSRRYVRPLSGRDRDVNSGAAR